MSQQSYTQNLPIRGMSMDTEPLKQPEGFASFVYNGVHDSVDGSRGSMTNEPGTERAFALPNFYRPVGRIQMQDEAIIFSTDGTTSEIGIVDYRTSVYTQLISDTCLNFQFSHLVKGVYRVIRGCERVIYFCDGFNSDKAINIDRLTDYQTNGNWDCSLMQLNPAINTPLIETSLADDGVLDNGSYEFAICYLDAVNNVVGYTPLMGRIHVFTPEDVTSKAITIEISNLDLRYERYALVVFQNNNVFRLPASRIINSTATYYLSSIPSGSIEITESEVFVPNANYFSSESMEQVEGRLLRGGLKETTRDFIPYGQAVKDIVVNYTINEVDPETYAPSLLRDEVYALGIMYKYADGSFSDVFHIPNNGANCQEGTVFNFCSPDFFRSNLTVTRTAPTQVRCDFTGLIDGDYEIDYEVNANGGTISGTTSLFTSSGGSGTATVNINLISAAPTDAQFTTFTFRLVSSDCEYTEADYSILTVGSANGSTYEANRGHRILTFQLEENTAQNGVLGCYACQNTMYENPECGDFWGGLVGERVRHFRMPDAAAEPLYNYETQKIRQLGLRVSNVTYPDSDIVGHFIMVARRGENDRTVISKGITGHLHTYNGTGNEYDYEGFTYARSSSQNTNGWSYFFSNETAYEDKAIQGSYLRKEGEYILGHQNNTTGCSAINTNDDEGTNGLCFQYDGSGNILWGANQKTYVTVAELQGIYFSGNHQSEAILNSTYAGPYFFDDSIDPGKRVMNASQLNPVQLVKLSNPLTNLTINKVGYASIKSARDVYCDIASIFYLKGHDDIGEENVTQDIYPGDVFISDINFANGLHAKNVKTIIDNLVKIYALTQMAGGIVAVGVLAPQFLSPEVLNVLGGAATQLISSALSAIGTATAAELTQAYHEMRQNKGLENLTIIDSDNFGIDCCVASAADGIVFANEHISKVYIESPYRSEFRDSLSIEGSCPRHYEGGDLLYYFGNKETLINDEADRDVTTNREPNFVPCPEIYDYDRNLLIDRRQIFPAFEFIICDECPGDFPHRIAYSEQSFSEDRQDRYRTFFANNFLDIPSHSGDIVNLKYYNNTLYIHAEDSTYVIRPNPREFQVEGDTLNIGTGGFLNLIPQELNHGDLRVGGCQHKYGHLACEYGYAWVDAKNGDVYFRDSSGLQRISDIGMSQYLRSNLPSSIEAYHREQVNQEYPRLDDSGPNGSFINLSYDPMFKRIILCKKDYVPEFDYTIQDVNNPVSTPVFDTEIGFFRQQTNGTIMSYIDFTQNGPYDFDRRCFSLSYSLENKSWTSFHSWLSLCSFYSNTNMFTSNIVVSPVDAYATAFHKHVDRKYCDYHDYSPRPFIVEYIDKNPRGFRAYVVQLTSQSFEYDETSDSYIQDDDVFWSGAWMYNNRESTGSLSLSSKDILPNYYESTNWYNPVLLYYTTLNDEVRIKQIRNRVVNPTSAIVDINTAYSGFSESGREDKQANNSNHNLSTLDYYNEPTIKGKWLKVRMYYLGQQDRDRKLIVDFIANKHGSYIR